MSDLMGQAAADKKRFADHCLEEIAKTFVMTIGEALTADPYAISQLLLSHRVRCNRALAVNPWIVVDTEPDADADGYVVGVLGLLNGIILKLTDHVLVCHTEPATHPMGTGFVNYQKVSKLTLMPKAEAGIQ